ncbi:diacylglycerol kinase family protein [Kosmotoga sp. DU53]|uniref:diacylglycerol kinase family protein n=1 Tax=Kosmotoga sp. DU53 TaxID=1310160 RepID=UPI0007C5199B|nr:diacylglycerol kinase family protein [Kosmotoga sp. DU53]OAA22188.1 hypothetical protein DU53_04925 [Kosmotoga sp. DU53]
MRAGVIVNTSAGKFEYIRKRISKLKEVFDEIVTGSGRFGGDFLEDVKIVDIVSSDFKSAIRELTIELSKCSDVIVSVGGDGTANFIAATLIDEKLNTPIMGIAGGTANVGPLVRFSLENIEKPSHIDFVDCLKVWKGNEHIGYAFIDVVFGDTFLGTLNGKMVNLSVKDFLESGRKVEIIPCDDIAEELDDFEKRQENFSQLKKSCANYSISFEFFGILYRKSSYRKTFLGFFFQISRNPDYLKQGYCGFIP